jgi:hypothetical protein
MILNDPIIIIIVFNHYDVYNLSIISFVLPIMIPIIIAMILPHSIG